MKQEGKMAIMENSTETPQRLLEFRRPLLLISINQYALVRRLNPTILR